jgi:hypothetical protein
MVLTDHWRKEDMKYLATYMDGSTESLTADSISEAKEAAEELYPDAPVKRVVVVDDSDEDDEDDNPGDSDDANDEDD